MFLGDSDSDFQSKPGPFKGECSSHCQKRNSSSMSLGLTTRSNEDVILTCLKLQCLGQKIGCCW